MKKKVFSYFITPFGVILFTLKYVFINGKKTKSVFRLLQFFKRVVLCPDAFDINSFVLNMKAIFGEKVIVNIVIN